MQNFLVMFFILLQLLVTKVQASIPLHGLGQQQGELVHFEFEGRTSWVYDIKRITKNKKTFVELTVDPISQKTMSDFENFKSDLVLGIKVNKQAPDKKNIIIFELANEDVEIFDYMTDQPSKLIVDFYISEQARNRMKKAAKANIKKKESKVESVDIVTESTRKPAADGNIISEQGTEIAKIDIEETEGKRAGVFDAADPGYERFKIKDYEVSEQSLIKSKDNYYIPFPALIIPNEPMLKARSMPTLYQITPQDNDENKMARLLLKLFNGKKWALFLQTLKWFKEKYPESQYMDLVSYMSGDVYYNRWNEEGQINDYELAVQEYQTAIKKYPAAAPAQKTSFLLGEMALRRGDILGAVRNFGTHIQNEQWPSEGVYSKDLAKLGLSFAYVKLKKPEESLKELTDLENKTKFNDLRVEAVYRRGDILSETGQHARAVEEYQKALKKFPEGKSLFPGALYNQAESLFQLGDYRKALDTYHDFFKHFPNNSEVPYGLTRVGEILDILGAEKTKVVGAYLETYFRFGEHPKAIVARLRLLSARMKGMKEKEVQNAIKDILKLAEKVDLPNIKPFSTILIADGYTSRGDHQKSIDLLTDYYKKNPTATDLSHFKKRIVLNIGEKIRAEVFSGELIHGLQTHEMYKDSWLKNSDRLDVPFYVGYAFEKSGVFKESQKVYRQILNQIYADRGTAREKNLLIQPNLPPVEALHLRLAAVEFADKNYQPAYDQIQQIKSVQKLNYPEQIERVILTSHLFEQKGDFDTAIRYLTEIINEWKGQPELVAPSYLRLAELELKNKSVADAEKSLQRIDALMTDTKNVDKKIHQKALQNLAEIYETSGRSPLALQTYEKLLSLYEKDLPMASVRYKYGKILFEKGDIQKAADAWNEFKGTQSEFWKNLAQEQLKNSNWSSEYKKYIDRIPAMAKTPGGE